MAGEMRDKEYRLVNLDLLNAAMKVSPTGIEQKAFSAMAQTIPTERETTIALLGAMLDGLQYGNWPK
jgi:hypothetical protein